MRTVVDLVVGRVDVHEDLEPDAALDPLGAVVDPLRQHHDAAEQRERHRDGERRRRSSSAGCGAARRSSRARSSRCGSTWRGYAPDAVDAAGLVAHERAAVELDDAAAHRVDDALVVRGHARRWCRCG